MHFYIKHLIFNNKILLDKQYIQAKCFVNNAILI